MSRKVNLSHEEQWLDTAWENIAEAQQDYQVQVFFAVIPTERRGVFSIRCGAFDAGRGVEDSTPLCEVVRPYPTAHTGTLATLLGQLSMSLASMLYSRAQQLQDARRASNGG